MINEYHSNLSTCEHVLLSVTPTATFLLLLPAQGCQVKNLQSGLAARSKLFHVHNEALLQIETTCRVPIL